MQLIEDKIKELYPSKEVFSKSINVLPTNLSKKLRTVKKRIDWFNNFLDPLELEVEIKDKQLNK